MRERGSRLLAAAYWLAPPLFCLAVYWPGLMAWFQQDDFVWLNLPNMVHGWHSLPAVLFQPTYAQGSWRPLSERAFFLVFGRLFGDYALPYRIFVFLTQFANLALAASITTRLTRSRAAGFWAAILWTANSNLATVMAWTSAYNLALCGFFLLLALHFFLRYAEAGERRYYVWTWLAFLTGFLAMETNVVFPLLAGTYALACARKYLRATAPFFAVSAAYAILHLALAPSHDSAIYRIHIDSALPATFLTYWRWALAPAGLQHLAWMGWLQVAASTLALLAFTIDQARRKQWLALVFLGWFAIMLAPVIPLRDHISDYYLTLPAMSLAMLGAYALVCSWRASAAWKALGLALVAGFLVLSLPVARRNSDWLRNRSEAAEGLVLGVARAHELHPGKVILVDGIDDMLFSAALSQRPFLYLAIPDVYMTPGSEARIASLPQVDAVSRFVLPVEEVRQGLDRGEIVVYRAGDGPLREITHHYTVPEAAGPLRVDAVDPLAAYRLGPTWYALEAGHRWMPRTASVRIPGPRSAAQKLYVSATCPAEQLAAGPLEMTLTIDSDRMPPVQFTKADMESTFVFTLPAGSTGKSDLEVTVKVNRTVRVGVDQRDVGLAFGRFEIR